MVGTTRQLSRWKNEWLSYRESSFDIRWMTIADSELRSRTLRDTWVKGFGRLVALSYRLPITSTMPQTSLETTSRFKYQSIFDSALRDTKRKQEITLPRIHYFAALRLAILQMLSSPYFGPSYLGLANPRVTATIRQRGLTRLSISSMCSLQPLAGALVWHTHRLE
ncbi:hypothetical protein BJV77DRAFT_680622 [Russula vinacea]|nr:hypothetical protein BJV77DRAFT_680622 [Russula vinacea]